MVNAVHRAANITRRAAFAAMGTLLLAPSSLAQSTIAPLAPILDGAATLRPLKAVIVARNGQVIAQRGYRSHTVAAQRT
jgi:hypothetical protein